MAPRADLLQHPKTTAQINPGLSLWLDEKRGSRHKVLYRQRHKIENMFGKLKDWRRVHTRYDRCAHAFMSAICIAATVIFWL